MAAPYGQAEQPPPYHAGPYGPGQPGAAPYPAGGQYGQPGAGQPGPGWHAGPQAAGQYGQHPQDAGSWQAGGPQHPNGWMPGPGHPGGNAGAAGPWQATGPGQGQDWAAAPGRYGPGMPAADGWQAAAPGYADPRHPGGPAPGQDWTPGDISHDDGAWQAGRPQPGWAPGHGQYGPGTGNAAAWQAAGAAAGPAWDGRPPYPGPGGAPGMRNTGGFSHAGSPVIRQRDSALPDPPPGPPGPKGPIAAIETDSIAAFARDLRVLRSKASLDYPEMAEKSHYTMRTLASAAGGLRLPTLPVLIAYVNACDGDVAAWEERWGKLSKSGKKQTALPAGDQQAGGQPRIPQNTRQTGEIYVITSAKNRDASW